MSTQTIADRYTVTGRIGAGGGGVVWRATDQLLGRTVAVKEVELPAHLSEDDRDRVRTRAMREARSAARLEHRSVVSIYDVLEDDDALHIVMEHVDAPSLATLISRDGPLSPERVADIGLDVLDGLAAAHAAGVVHRDVKPSNVLVNDPGRAVVTDFGIAAVLGESGLTRTGQALGTPDYIAPEQLEEGPVGPPCDLWALGATLYAGVEGVPPFRRDRAMATAHAVVSSEPRPPERAGPLRDVLLQLLHKDPAERPDAATTRQLLRSAREAAGQGVGLGADAQLATTELIDRGPDTEAVAPDPAEPREPDRVDESHRSDERLRAALVLGGLVAAAVVITAVVLGSGGGDTTSPEQAQQDTESQAAGNPEAGPEGDGAADSSDPAGRDAPPTEQDAQGAQDAPEEATSQAVQAGEAAPPPEGWTLYETDDYAVAVPSQWEQREGPGSAVDLVAPDGDVYLRAADTGDPAEDVLADTQRIRDSFRSRYPSYQEVSLEPVEYRGHEAVRWEYTYAPDGRELRAVHLNFSTGDRAYALNYQAPAAQWDELADRFDEFTATFRER